MIASSCASSVVHYHSLFCINVDSSSPFKTHIPSEKRFICMLCKKWTYLVTNVEQISFKNHATRFYFFSLPRTPPSKIKELLQYECLAQNSQDNKFTSYISLFFYRFIYTYNDNKVCLN